MTDTEMRDDLQNIQLNNDTIDEGLYSRQLFVLVRTLLYSTPLAHRRFTGCRRYESDESI